MTISLVVTTSPSEAEPLFLAHMNDALAASALVAAILAAFFTLWQGEIQAAIDKQSSTDRTNWEPTAKPIRHALYWRAWPLLVIAVATLAVVSVRSFGIAKNAIACFGRCAYDDVQALFLLTAVLILGLVLLTLVQIYRLTRRLIDGEKKRKEAALEQAAARK